MNSAMLVDLVTGCAVHIHEPLFRIGRQEDTDLSVDDGAVSRVHCCITVRGGSYFLTDLGSANGTSAGDRVLKPHVPVQITDGTVIRIAGKLYLFVFVKAEGL